MNRTLMLLLVCVMAASIFTAAGCGSGGGGEREKLTVAMELAYPPFETKDNDGNPSGVSVDFAKDLGEYLGMDVEIVNTAWDGLIPSLQTGKADMVISSMTITEQRRESVDFSIPYANALLAILANKSAGVRTIDDLNAPGRKVAVKTNSTGHLYAQEHLREAEIITLADESACVVEVMQGKADGFLYDQLTVYRNNMRSQDATDAIYIPFQNVEYWGAAVKKGNDELLSGINEFIAAYTADGGFERLSEKYLAEEKEAFGELGFKWFFDLEN